MSIRMSNRNTEIVESLAADAVTTAAALVAAIEESIASGRIGPGETLPSVRALAPALGIAPNTAARAYRTLRERGVVVGRGRQGTTVAERPDVWVGPALHMPPDTIDATNGAPDISLLPPVVAAMTAASKRVPAMYGDAVITAELADAAARWLQTDGVDTEHLTLTHGAMDAIERLLVSHTRLGDRVAVEDPGHRPVHDVVRMLGLTPIPVSVDDAGMRPGSLRTALDRGVKVVIVTPRAQNPTGASFDSARAADLRRELADHPDVLAIEDDHAGPMSGTALHTLDHQRANWALVRSVSKTLGPDLRLAFVVGDRTTIHRVETRLSIGPGWVSHLLQHTVANLLDDPTTRDLIAAAATQYGERRRRFVDRLAVHGVDASAISGLNVWVPVDDEQNVVDAARNAGFAIRAGASYRIASRSAVRVTIAALDAPQIKRLADAIVDSIGTPASTNLPQRIRTA